MGRAVSIYFQDDVLERLDSMVAHRAARDRATGRTGRGVASRSSVIEELVLASDRANEPLDRATISYHVVSLAEEYGAKKVSLFGSYGRGEATGDSDVDLLLDKGAIKGLKVLDFQEELSCRLGRKVDVVTTAGANERFLGRIADDCVTLYESSMRRGA